MAGAGAPARPARRHDDGISRDAVVHPARGHHRHSNLWKQRCRPVPGGRQRDVEAPRAVTTVSRPARALVLHSRRRPPRSYPARPRSLPAPPSRAAAASLLFLLWRTAAPIRTMILTASVRALTSRQRGGPFHHVGSP